MPPPEPTKTFGDVWGHPTHLMVYPWSSTAMGCKSVRWTPASRRSAAGRNVEIFWSRRSGMG